LTRQVSKGVARYGKDPAKLMGTYEAEVYFVVKNKDILGTVNVINHVVYRVIEAVAWGIRSRSLLTMFYGVTGSIKGFIKGVTYA
jgi:hypothetical protein